MYQKEKLNLIYSELFQYILFVTLCVSWWLDVKIPFVEKEYLSLLFALVIANVALNNKAFNYLGKISFGLYVYHLIGIDLAIELFKYFEAPYHPVFVLGLIFTVLI